MYWDMTKKMRGHASLLPGEICHAAVYGLGRGALDLADKAGGTKGVYVDELDRGEDPSSTRSFNQTLGTHRRRLVR